MKKSYTRIGFFLAICFWMLFSGCETSLEFPNHNLTKLTIISHLSPQGWEEQRVFVYASLSPADSSQFYTPALLEVDVTEVETDLLIRLDSTREGDQVFFRYPPGFLKAGHTYSITAYAPGFEPVHATTVIPQPSTISNLSILDIRIEPSEKNEFKEIVRYKLVFDINHVEDNRYYHLVFYNKYAGIDNPIIIDPELSDQQSFLHHYDFGILIDREDLVPNEPLTFHFVDWVIENGDLERVYVELRTLTEEYYRYHSSLARQLIVRQDPFAEPVTIFNNIDGGYGNFSGFFPDISSFEMPN